MLRRARNHRSAGRPQASIDMTSLIDLTFLLLVTFIITMPALERGVSIILPRAKTDVLPTKNNKSNTISIDAQSRVFLNGRATTLEELEKSLSSLAADDPDVPVLVRGDERLTYKRVMEVVKIVYKCRIHRMALVTVEG